jgi:hypothetical protein
VTQDLPPPTPEDAAALREIVEGLRLARAAYVVTRLGVPDLLADGPLDAATIAERTDAHPGAVYRVMRALANRGVFEERDNGFALTASGQLLRRDVPGSLREWTLWHGSEWVLEAWREFEHSVRTGEPSFDRAHGRPFFEYLSSNPDMAAAFGGAMVSISRMMDEAALTAFDFGRFGTVADIGGGRGALLALIARRYPDVRGLLFDLPPVIASAREFLTAEGLADRIECVAGDFFQAVPDGADAYVLKAILHDWNDDQARSILQNCRRAIGTDATLLVIGMTVPERDVRSPIKELDLQMLAIQTGRERTRAELRDLLASAGFELTEVLPTASPLAVSVARPA